MSRRLRAWARGHRRIHSVLLKARNVGEALERAGRFGRQSGRGHPESYRIWPIPRPVEGPWPAPPTIERPFAVAEASEDDATVDTVHRYDVALFESLNAEFRSHPVAPVAPTYESASIAERSRARIRMVHERLDLRGKTVLEVGCGAGYEAWYLAQVLDCDAWGIDIRPRRAWPELAGDRVHLIAGDMATGGLLPPATFDRAISFTVWEHINRPVEAIQELFRVMKPGGLAWIRANLYRGPTASHLTRDVAFPFPHLLFSDDVIAEALGRAGKRARGAVWVNRLTWEQYERAFQEAGFTIKAASFTRYPLDESFYRRFEDVLGRYPRADLERGFFQVVLQKARR